MLIDVVHVYHSVLQTTRRSFLTLLPMFRLRLNLVGKVDMIDATNDGTWSCGMP